MEYYPVCKFTDVGFGEAKEVVVAGHPIAIFNVGGKLFAIDNLCPHMSAPLDTGVVNGKHVVCRLHFWEIDITTGQSIDPPGHCVATHPVKVERGIVKVAVASAPQSDESATACDGNAV